MSKTQQVLATIKTDFQLIKAYICITYVLWIPVGVIINVLQGGLFFSLCTVCGVGMFGCIMQLGTSDEVSGNFQLLRLTFPVSRAAIQIGHACVVLLVSTVGFLIGLFSAALSQVILNMQGKGDVIFGFWGEVAFSIILFAFFLLIGTIMLTCLAKFGFTKGFRYFPLLIALIGVIVVPFLFSTTFGEQAAAVLTGDNEIRLLAALASLLFSGVLYVVGTILSVVFYKKRQF